MFDIQNRRYTGCKYKLMDWIKELIEEYCEGDTFFDVFSGTGVVTKYLLDDFNNFIMNDFLFSNEVIYNGFFLQQEYNPELLNDIKEQYNNIDRNNIEENYMSNNFGDKFFAMNDARLIGYIREDIKDRYEEQQINEKEYYILLASLLYSMDRVANTVGHYDAYIKNKMIKPAFNFELIDPIELENDKQVTICRRDANELVREVRADIAFIDPPYNSRQYSRFYHVLENVVQWKKPELMGVALKPEPENMSDYCKASAPKVFADLVENLNVNYVVVTYNNTYNSKSNSSKNKITLEQIKETLERKGETRVFEKSYRFFTTGKSDFKEHKELVFITRVG